MQEMHNSTMPFPSTKYDQQTTQFIAVNYKRKLKIKKIPREYEVDNAGPNAK